MTAADLPAWLALHLPEFTPTAVPEKLTGGLLNRVWRVAGIPEPVVLKYAPDHVGTVPLDPARIGFEAAALEAFGPGGLLAAVPGGEVQVPRLYAFDAPSHVLAMQDLGQWPTLDGWLLTASLDAARQYGDRLGGFVGRLHSVEVASLRAWFDNAAIQRTRLAVQYAGIEATLRAAGVDAAADLGRRARHLGERLLAPGVCLTMGDLWPRSVLVGPDGLSVIDWEMVHVGQPWQDTAHFAAHLWMLAHRRPHAAEAVRAFAAGFVEGYEAGSVWGLDEVPEAAWHAGCELLVRALGPFRDGYLYDRLPPKHQDVRGALWRAVHWLRADAPQPLWL